MVCSSIFKYAMTSPGGRGRCERCCGYETTEFQRASDQKKQPFFALAILNGSTGVSTHPHQKDIILNSINQRPMNWTQPLDSSQVQRPLPRMRFVAQLSDQ